MSDLLGDPEYVQVLDEQITITISNLTAKRNALISQLDTHNQLKQQIKNTKDGNVMVFLGDGYFVEKNLNDAAEFLDRRIDDLNQTVGQFGTKINEATATYHNLQKFRELENEGTLDLSSREEAKLNSEGLPFMDIQEELDENGDVIVTKINNEVYSIETKARLPYQPSKKELESEKEEIRSLIIQKHLFETPTNEALKTPPTNNSLGTPPITNIITESPGPKEQRNSTTRGSGSIKSNTQALIESDDDDDDQFTELLQDMEVISKKPSTPLLDQEDLLNKIDQLKVSPDDKFKLKQICIKEFEKLQEEEDDDEGDVTNSLIENWSTDTDLNSGDNFSIANMTSDLSENSLDEVKGRERQEVIANIIKENNLENLLDEEASMMDPKDIASSSTPRRTATVERDDILELELLADEFDDSDGKGTSYADDEEWDFEFSETEVENDLEDKEIDDDDLDDDGDDDDDDFSDSMLYGNGASYGNKTADEMLWNKVMELRKTKNQLKEDQSRDRRKQIEELRDSSVSPSPAQSIKSILKERPNEPKKSVRFSESLQIKEIENISGMLREIQPVAKMSLFRQRIESGIEEVRNSIGASMDKTQITEELVSPGISRISKFRDYISQGKKVDVVSSPIINDEPFDRLQVISDSIKDIEDNAKGSNGQELAKSKKLSRFKSMMNDDSRIKTQVTVGNISIKDGAQQEEPVQIEGSVKEDFLSGDIIERDFNEGAFGMVQESFHEDGRVSGSSHKSCISGETVSGTSSDDFVKKNITVSEIPKRVAKVSKFKASLMKKDAEVSTPIEDFATSPFDREVQISLEKDSFVAMGKFPGTSNQEGAIFEKSATNILVADIVEKEIADDATRRDKFVEPELNITKPGKVSRFKQRQLKKGDSKLQIAPNVTNKRIEIIGSEDDDEDEEDTPEDDELGIQDDNLDGEIKEATVDFTMMQDDMDTMAKAYVLGMYDDDILTQGPVVNELKDFEVLNRMLESMPQHNSSKAERSATRKKRQNMESFDEEMDQILPAEEYGEDSDDDHGPVVVDEIVENVFDYNQDDLLQIEEGIEDDLLHQEVISNYHRLRQKVIFENNHRGFRKSDQEMEFEPVDEEGIPVTMSRFRATKMNQFQAKGDL